MHLIENTPAPCAHCGTGNTPHSDGTKRRFVDLERDINWNDPLILCEDCILKLGGMIGLLSKETMHELKTKNRELAKQIHDLNATVGTMQRRAKRLGIEFTGDASKMRVAS